VNKTGIHAKIFFWIGSGGAGFADHQEGGRRPVDQAEQREHAGRIGGREVFDPAEERRMTHFDGDEQDLVEREEYRDLEQDR